MAAHAQKGSPHRQQWCRRPIIQHAVLAACANLLLGKLVLSADGDIGTFCVPPVSVPSAIDGGREQWLGAASIKNKVYSIPHAAASVLIYDPGSNTMTGSETIPPSLTSEDSSNNWSGGVALHNKLYGMPCRSKHVLVYNPSSNKISGSEKIPTSIDGAGCSWYGGVVMDNTVYGVPLDSDYVLKYNPSSNIVTGSEKIPDGLNVGDGKSGGGVAYNGKLYMVPLNSKYILIFDPSTNKVTGSEKIDSRILGYQAAHQWQGAVELNGKIYGIPSNANTVLIYDPSTNKVTASPKIEKQIDVGDLQWSGGFALHGKIYGIPYNSKHVLVYDPTTDSFDGSVEIPASLNNGDAQWHGGLELHGKLYSVPWDSNVLLKYEPPEPKGTFAYSNLPADIDNGAGLWMGGVEVKEKVIGIPQNADYVLIYDPVTNVAKGSEKIPTAINPKDSVGQWSGAVEVDGKVYGIPSDSDYVLIFDPVTEKSSASKKVSSEIDSGRGQWAGGVALDGKVYGIPSNSDHVLVYNPSTGEVTGSQQIPSSVDTGKKQWFGGVVYDDKIFGIPRDANKVLIYDPAANRVTGSDRIPSTIDTGTAQWFGGVEVNGKIYGIPSNADYVLIYDPEANALSGAAVPRSIDSGDSQWRDGVVLNGKVYGIPFYAEYVLVYDPFTNAVTGSEKIPTAVRKGEKQWTGGVAINGRLIGIPADSDFVLVYDPPASLGSFSASSQVPTSFRADSKQWRGSVALEGKVYSIPHNSDYAIVYDIASDTITGSTKVPGTIDGGDSQWSGGVTVGKKVYGIPYNADYVFVLDTTTSRVTGSSKIPASIASGGGQWQGGAARGSAIYGVPFNADYVLIYDTETGTVSGSPKIPNDIQEDDGREQWNGGVIRANKLYAMPSNAKRVLIYDIQENTVAGSDPIPAYMITGKTQWAGAVLLNGLIYGVPAKASFILIFDPATNSVTGSKVPCALDSAAVGNTGIKWFGGLAIGNKVFGIPHDSNRILVYDPDTNTAASSERVSASELNSKAANWAGGVSFDGKLYGTPSNADHMLVYKPVVLEGGTTTTTTFSTTTVSTTTVSTTTVSTTTMTTATSTTVTTTTVTTTTKTTSTNTATTKTTSTGTATTKTGTTTTGTTTTGTTTTRTATTRTATITTVTVTTRTATVSTSTETSTTITATTTSTTATFVNFGDECTSNGQCASGRCRSRCCNIEAAAAAADVCSACSSGSIELSVDRGACYTKLAMADGWAWSDSNNSENGWKGKFDKDQETVLQGPPSSFRKNALLDFKGVAGDVKFVLRWGPPTASPLQTNGQNPSRNLERAGEGLDPGLFDVDPRTGTISAKPKRNGQYSMYLVAHDNAGTAARLGLRAELDQVVLKRLDFEVNGKPDFVVISYSRVQPEFLAKGSENDAPYASAAKIGALNCTVGTTYRIAPINADEFVYKFASGKIRFTIQNPPPNFFVNPETGEIQGKPQTADIGSTTKSTLLATDESGGVARLEPITFTMFGTSEFKLVTDADGRRATKPGVRYFDPTPESADEFFVGESYAYKIAPLMVDLVATTVSRGTASELTYTLSPDAPDSFFVQANDGIVFGQFVAVGTYQFSLLAIDKGGMVAEVEKYTFKAVAREAFRVLAFEHEVDPSKGYTVIETPLTLAIGDTYAFAPLNITAAENAIDVLSELQFSLKDAPSGFLLDASSGFIQGTPAVKGEHTMELYAVNSLNDRAFVENISFSILPKDVDVPKFGPNGQPCTHGASVDAVLFDEAFTCDCNFTRYEGPNCATLIIMESTTTIVTDANSLASVGGVIGGMIFLLLLALVIHKYKMRMHELRAFDFKAQLDGMVERGELEGGIYDTIKHRRMHDLNVPREIKRGNLTLIKIIGEGAFGEVWKAVLDESSVGGVPGYMVAVKTTKAAKGEGADEITREATVMAQMKPHPNLVSLIGVVTSGTPLMLVISMCEHGSLLSLLRDRKLGVRGWAPFSFAERLQFAIEIATGMAHLLECKFIHRDLAARNVLVDSEMICKIADFGLARGVHLSSTPDQGKTDGADPTAAEQEYYRSSRGTFPVRWTAPEAMQTLRFSEKSDVWSFGIVMLEIYDDGAKPYTALDNTTVISKVQAGYRAPKPELATVEAYNIMLMCWDAKPEKRPTFAQLVGALGRLTRGHIMSPDALESSTSSIGRFQNSTALNGRGGSVSGHHYLDVIDQEGHDSDADYLDVADRQPRATQGTYLDVVDRPERDTYDNPEAGLFVPQDGANSLVDGNEEYLTLGGGEGGDGGNEEYLTVGGGEGGDADAIGDSGVGGDDGGDEYLTLGGGEGGGKEGVSAEQSPRKSSLFEGFETGSDGGDGYLTADQPPHTVREMGSYGQVKAFSSVSNDAEESNRLNAPKRPQRLISERVDTAEGLYGDFGTPGSSQPTTARESMESIPFGDSFGSIGRVMSDDEYLSTGPVVHEDVALVARGSYLNPTAPVLNLNVSWNTMPGTITEADAEFNALGQTLLDVQVHQPGSGPSAVFDKMATAADKDGDGMVSLGEAAAMGMDTATFNAIDADGNGQLNRSEVESWAKQNEAAAANMLAGWL